MNPKSILVISDTHFGCKLGLCPPEGAVLDEGGIYSPSPLQKVVWYWWEEFWEDWVPKATKGEPYRLVHNGDVIDGDHHKSSTPISSNLLDQRRLAVEVLKRYVGRAEQYFSVRGTPAHVGESSREEEQVAQELGAVPNKVGQHSRFDLWLKLGDHSVHFLHHVGTTSSSAHESSAVNAELIAEFVEAARWGFKRPSVVVRSHRHRSLAVKIPTSQGEATGIVTPAFQLKTPFTFKIAGARLAPPQIGGIVIRLDDMGNCYTTSFVKHIQPDDPE